MIPEIIYRKPEDLAYDFLTESFKKPRRRFYYPQYKYLKKEYADALINDGTIRVGTLNDFRVSYEEDIQRRDPGEGFKNSQAYKENDFKKIIEDNKLVKRKQKIKGLEPIPESVKEESELLFYKFREHFIGNVEIDKSGSVNFKHADIYIYCTSGKLDRDVMESFDCDTCLKIIDPYLFFAHITHNFLHQIDIGEKSGYDWGFCRYFHPFLSLDPECPEYLMKNHTYSQQNEFRFCWIPYFKKDMYDLVKFEGKVGNLKNRTQFKDLEPRIVTVPEIRSCVELIEF